MEPHEYQERVYAVLDTMKTEDKDRIILGFVGQLYPRGDPDHEVAGADFIAEAVRLLAPFHPVNLSREAETPSAEEEHRTEEF